jgi:uncharacterized protein YsxB (DUF464 family)
MTKRDEVRDFVKRESREALNSQIADMSNREHAEVIRQNRDYICAAVAWHLAEEYRFLQLADIMEWKRTRVRR